MSAEHTPDTEDQTPARNERYHAMDALRAVAMALGVVLHASVTYMQTPMPGLLWPTDPSPALTWGWFFDGVFWYLHGFRIPLFFVIAGFFAVMLCNSRGPAAFLNHRVKRILVPLVGSVIVILPLTYLAWGVGLMQSQRFDVTWRQVRKLRFKDPQVAHEAFGLAHMWFLEYLFVICVGLYVWWRVRPLRVTIEGPPRWTDRLLLSVWKPLPLAAVTGLIYFARPDLYSHFVNEWVPDPAGLLHYTVFFVVGVWMFRLRDRLERMIDFSWAYLLISTGAFVLLAMILKRTLPGDAPLTSNMRLAMAASAGVFCWFSVFGYLGVFLRVFNTHRAIVRYWSDAAYWVYIAHLPVVALLQIGLVWMSHRGIVTLPVGLQFLIVLAGALGATMLTYRYWVRYTWVGVWLNGPRRRPDHTGGAAEAGGSTGAKPAIAEPAQPSR